MLHLVSYLFMVCCLSTAFSNEKLLSEDSREEFRFKLEAYEDSITEFVVKIPPKFTHSYNAHHPEHLQIEFIQTGEKFDNWSEIITVSEDILYEVDIHKFIQTFVDHYESKTPKVDCCPTFRKERNITIASILADPPATLVTLDSSCRELKYDEIKEKNEIVGMKAVQGRFSLARVQYTIRYTKDSLKERAAAKEKVLNFLNSCPIQPRQIKDKTSMNDAKELPE